MLTKISNKNSKKITVLNFLLISLIVLIHCDNRTILDYKFLGGGVSSFYEIIYKVCETAVPTFYALSGYLFYRGCNKDNVWGKLKSRCCSILIPYFFWNSIFYLAYFVIDLFPALSAQVNVNMPKLTLYSIVFANYANPPLWFLRKLFILQLFSPIVYYLFLRLKNISLVILGGVALIDICIQFGYSSLLHWASIYYVAGYIAINCSTTFESVIPKYLQNNKATTIIVTVLLFSLSAFISRIQWVCAPVIWYLIMSCISEVKSFNFMKVSFFIFCTHYIVILFLRKVLILLIGTSISAMVCTYFVTFVVTMIVTTSIALIIKKITPRIYSFLCGGR